MADDVYARELAHHEELYSGFAQQHFAKPAVRAFRAHLSARILKAAGIGRDSRVLSLGCGLGDQELLLAPHAGHLTGVDLSPQAIRGAREDAQKSGIANVSFFEGSLDHPELSREPYDAILAIFFLHHVPDEELPRLAGRIRGWLKPGGVFYALDPNRYRLSGAVGKILVPHLMRRYQTPDERELRPSATAQLFAGAGMDVRAQIYDFTSTPLAGLFPSWRLGYRAARAIDEVLIRVPGLRILGSNFEIVARRGDGA